MNKRLSIEEQLADLGNQKEILLKKQIQIRGNKKFLCVCGAEHKIKDCAALQCHWYEAPSGYTGSSWNTGEINIFCPDQHIKNRILFKTPEYGYYRSYDHSAEMQFSRMFRKSFKSIKDDFEEDKTPWVNNYYFERNHKKFGIDVQK